MKSKLISISAISSAFVAIVLTIGVYFNMADLFCLVVASVFVMLPLYYKSHLAGFLSYLAGGVIAFIFSGFNFLIVTVPAYFVFFGVFPLVKNLMEEKNFNKYVRYLIGLIWCVLAVYGMFFFYKNVMNLDFSDLPVFVKDNLVIVVGLLGVIFYVVYERFLTAFRRIIDELLKKVLK